MATEKIKVKTVREVKKTDEWTKISIVTEDGRTLFSFAKLEEGKEYEGTIEHSEKYNEDTFKLANKGFGKKDWKFEKKNAALRHAVASVNITDKAGVVSSDNIITLARKYEKYLSE